jgi:hypothetical protein
MTVADQSLVSLALDLGKLPASELDLIAVLNRVCAALPVATGLGGAVILVTEPSEEEATLVASGGKAEWIGDAQRRARSGPLFSVLRSARPMRTLDLTRSGPPPLAAAAAKSGLVSSLVVPLEANGTVYGALQLLGAARRPVEPKQVDLVRMLLDVVVARLVDVRALRLARAAVVPVFPVVPAEPPAKAPDPAPARARARARDRHVAPASADAAASSGVEVATAVIPSPRTPGRRPRTEVPRAEGRRPRQVAPDPAGPGGDADEGTRRLPTRPASGGDRARVQPEPRRSGRHSLG